MRLPLTKFDSIALTIIIVPLTLSPLCLLLLVRLGGCIVNLFAFYFYKLIGKLNAFLQLQEVSLRNQWPVPLPPRGVLLTTQVECGQHPRQGYSTTDCLEYRWRTYSF
jgi:hypothetical protein